ncbi:MAG TPA: hypothetical protein VIN38_01075 [Thiobacillus sp.]
MNVQDGWSAPYTCFILKRMLAPPRGISRQPRMIAGENLVSQVTSG